MNVPFAVVNGLITYLKFLVLKDESYPHLVGSQRFDLGDEVVLLVGDHVWFIENAGAP